MATSKKAASKNSKKAPAKQVYDTLLVLVMTWVFTLLSVVFAVVAFWRYA